MVCWASTWACRLDQRLVLVAAGDNVIAQISACGWSSVVSLKQANDLHQLLRTDIFADFSLILW